MVQKFEPLACALEKLHQQFLNVPIKRNESVVPLLNESVVHLLSELEEIALKLHKAIVNQFEYQKQKKNIFLTFKFASLDSTSVYFQPLLQTRGSRTKEVLSSAKLREVLKLGVKYTAIEIFALYYPDTIIERQSQVSSLFWKTIEKFIKKDRGTTLTKDYNVRYRKYSLTPLPSPSHNNEFEVQN
jgi:hypothetical protein